MHAVRQLIMFSLPWFLITESWCSFQSGKKVKYPIVVFEGPFGLKQCVKECLLRKRCQTVGYHRGQLQCELGGNKDVMNVSDPEYKTAYRTELSEYQELLGHCTRHSCEEWQKCVVTKSGQLGCVKDCDKMTNYTLINSGDDYVCQKVYVIGYQSVLYNTAASRCQENGGRLMIMDKEWKINTMASLLPNSGYDFINGFKNENGTWKFSDGNAFVQIASVQYTLMSNYHHVILRFNRNVKSVHKNTKCYGFICEL